MRFLKILIYINDSLGELDWIAPFIRSKECSDIYVELYFNLPKYSLEKISDIVDVYGLDLENVKVISHHHHINNLFSKIDLSLNELLSKVLRYMPKKVFSSIRYFFDLIRKMCSFGLIFDQDYDYIFRDYNLKESIALNAFIRCNPNAKIVVYPHAVSINRIIAGSERPKPKKVKVSLLFENSVISNYWDEYYKDVLCFTGAPALSEAYSKEKLFDPKSDKIVFLSRLCDNQYGFDLKTALLVFDYVLSYAKKKGEVVIVKHHPRDMHLDKWREIQVKYDNVEEFNGSLTCFTEKVKVCLSLFSTAGLYLLARGVPVFDISPYFSCSECAVKYPFHYLNKSGVLTHDLIEYGVIQRMNDLGLLDECLSEQRLHELSVFQLDSCKKLFPEESNYVIRKELNELVELARKKLSH